MKPVRAFVFLLFTAFNIFSQQEIKTFLLNKDEYKYLEAKNLLVTEAIKNAFGLPTKQNYYKIDITQIDAWNSKVTEFKYYPGVNGDNKKSLLNSSVLSSKENMGLKLRVSLNQEKSFLNDALKPYLNERGAFILNIVVVGDPRIFVAEAKDKTDYSEIINDQAFADRVFKTSFGDNPKKMNYDIAFDKTRACLVKNIITAACADQFEFSKGDNIYGKFCEKITSAEYSSGYILFDLPVVRQRSNLSQVIEQALIKENDGSEHVKFYFCIPKDNVKAKKNKLIEFGGKILSGIKTPLKDLVVYLRDGLNTVIQTQTTDKNGFFKFDKIQEGINYSIFIDNSCKEKVLYLTSKNDKPLGEFKKSDIGFEYKIIDAVMTEMKSLEEIDPSEDFKSSIKGRMVSVSGKINPIKGQVIELKNSSNQVVQTQKTDANGNFVFTSINPNHNYSVELPDYTSSDKNEKVYLANAKNELVKQFKKNENNKFSFKILPAEICQLESMNEPDLEITFGKQKNLNQSEIVIHDFVYYNLNSFQISPESKPTLDKIAKLVSENALYKVEIISHTDSRGETLENQKLSEKRSESVIAYLITKKIDPKRLKPSGMGESKPLNACTDGSSCIEDEFKMNRRTEFKFYK